MINTVLMIPLEALRECRIQASLLHRFAREELILSIYSASSFELIRIRILLMMMMMMMTMMTMTTTFFFLK
jgi:hypothetical protein